MPRLRAYLTSLLLLAGLLLLAEYRLRQQPAAPTRGEVSGWNPCGNQYLQPPISTVIRTVDHQQRTQVLTYDQYGLRSPTTERTVQRPLVMCLGDEQVLAGHVLYETTFCDLWDQAVTGGNSGAIAVVNGGMPSG